MNQNGNSMLSMGQAARHAAAQVAVLDSERKNAALQSIANEIENAAATILAANEQDKQKAVADKVAESFIDRLALTPERIASIASGVRKVAELGEPVGRKLSTVERPNGLVIEKVSTPIGVIGVIFESRPNVTADAAALCLKSGNAVILRGGSAAHRSNLAIHAAIQAGLEKANVPTQAIQIVETTDRSAVGELLTGLNGTIDVIIPRGGKSLVARVQEEARVPVFAHLEGICHTFIHRAADPEMTKQIILNAKLRRTGICGATETLLVDQQFPTEELCSILETLRDAGCEVRGGEAVRGTCDWAAPAAEGDWRTEYLDAILSVRIVEDLAAATEHIACFGSSHTEAIITEELAAAEYFFKHVDSAIVMHNASTQFADGGEFGMGAEIGIATGKMHARGPVGTEQLTTFKYLVYGKGQVRPK